MPKAKKEKAENTEKKKTSAKKTKAQTKTAVKTSAAKKTAKKPAEKKEKLPKAKHPKTKIKDDLLERLVTERVGTKKSHPAVRVEEKREEAKIREEHGIAVAEEKKEKGDQVQSLPAGAEKKKITINEQITIKMLAEKMDVNVGELIKKLLSMGNLVTINQRVDSDTAALIAAEYGYETEWVPLYGEDQLQKIAGDIDPKKLKPRAPVVTIMGHVDHGKTSLLDSIRKADVVSTEMGGITQHIGAYKVKASKGDIVFLDTPGHEAFTAMRARGAQVTDIVVLVVAADDGIKPQTVEAIDHAKAAGVPIIVAINKIDLPGANVQKVKQELAAFNMLAEDWGGKTVTVEVSAKQGKNIEQLLEMILLEAELLELKADPTANASGTVVEARMDPKKGVVATLLVQNGTMRITDCFVAGVHFGKIRALVDDHGSRIKEAPPSTPVEVLGMSQAPQAGDRFFAVTDERKARDIARMRQLNMREEQFSRRKHITLEDLNKRISEDQIKELKVVLKADVQGSIGALRDSLEKLSTDAITLRVIHSGVGGINESDVILAAASDALIIGFNVRPDSGAELLASKEGVEINTYRIIYEVVADVRAALEGLLEPESKEKIIGRAAVKEVFRISKVGLVCGSYVKDGQIQRNAKVRIIRDGVIIFESVISGLKRFKDDVRTVDRGYECGVFVENAQDLKPDDVIECYTMEKIARKLEVT